MDYNDYRTYILTCEYLGKEPTGQYKTVYDFLTGLWDGMEVMVDSQTNQIILHKGGVRFKYQDLKNRDMWCNYIHVWSFFQKDMTMELIDIQDFIRSEVEEHLKSKVGTPNDGWWLGHQQVEEHLICKVGTPFDKKAEDEL